MQDQPVDEDEVVFYNPDEHRPDEYRAPEGVLAQPELVLQAVELMRQARRPIAGDGQGYAASGQVVQQFIETTRIPVPPRNRASKTG